MLWVFPASLYREASEGWASKQTLCNQASSSSIWGSNCFTHPETGLSSADVGHWSLSLLEARDQACSPPLPWPLCSRGRTALAEGVEGTGQDPGIWQSPEFKLVQCVL